MVKRKSSLGRQKIALEKISKKNNLQVTFSKRRAGLFKKASELCTLCGVEVAIIVFSPADKAFSFGHPEVESIVDKFLLLNAPSSSGAHQLIEAHRKANVRELNIQLCQILSHIESERKRGEVLTQMRKAGQSQNWWESPIEELGLSELVQLRDALEELKKNISKQAANQIFVETSKGVGGGNNNGNGHVGNFVSKSNEAKVPAAINPSFNTFGYGHGNF